MVYKLCGIESEDTEHLILDCDTLGDYWSYVVHLIRKLCHVKVSEKMFILGDLESEIEITADKRLVLNWLLEEAKWVIWRRRCKIRYEEVWINDR